MTLQAWLANAQKQLSDAGIDTARLDCLVLLEDATGKDRAWLLTYPDYILQRSVVAELNTKIVQRVRHMPLAYLRGHAEFYGRTFAVNAHTLVPRPETEAIIELLKTLPEAKSKGTSLNILDMGTGSGCIAITAALELPWAQVSACDIDPQCLETARQNAAKLGTQVTFFESDLLAGLAAKTQAESRSQPHPQTYDIILANLPYVPDSYLINAAAAHEPHLALFGGADGLGLYRRMFQQFAAPTDPSINSLDTKPFYILTESLPEQHKTLAAIAKTAGFHLQKTDGFVQLFARI